MKGLAEFHFEHRKKKLQLELNWLFVKYLNSLKYTLYSYSYRLCPSQSQNMALDK